MADDSDATQPFQPLDLIFSCNVCHDSIRDIRGPMQDGKELENIRKPVAKLWMTECAHLICAKHLEGGVEANTTQISLIISSNAHLWLLTPKMVVWTRFEYDIKHSIVRRPQLILLQFQFLGLVTYGIAIATKFRGLQAAHTGLKDQAEKSKLEKAEAETEIQTLTERITLLEEVERRHKAKQPEIEHYLRQFTLVKKELDRRNEDLTAMGYPPPPIDYTFSPSRLIEDDTSDGRRTTSPTRLKGRGDRADPRAVDDSLPSVSSITLRGDSSRAYTEDDLQRTENKRQKLAEYSYKPQSIQTPSGKPPDRERPGIRLPPQSSVIPNGPSRSDHFQTIPKLSQLNNQQPSFAGWSSNRDHVAQLTDISRDKQESWGRTDPGQYAEARFEDPPYMSGALGPGDQNISDSTDQSKQAKQLKRKVQPADSIDEISRSNLNTAKRPRTSSYLYQQRGAEEHSEHEPRDLILLRHNDSIFSDKQKVVR
ncbi:hypothetical protein E4T38_00716 [Aureobasidium subglaciale]|nr:hypothetical protein E4T38_00716 [Aureobasidium subglaciale]KAI5231128.1 hypothetical protein E4T40_00717 [Aureobasidium subglaciale]KAI5234253.1 hypothetical protein E4T41_00715 [Aureobasidium subglaciale]KAI5267574.1 hypothetical protein E4T46_00715 [Aureobasidium subglaciale]